MLAEMNVDVELVRTNTEFTTHLKDITAGACY